ncbi:hypothetical protein AL060_21860 [Pseudomonas syringae pv. rhaphiolepidis]|nr:hypothetical protein AL060_21860 [Pseudomonas syringae pv. rhaphiolepidis]
MIRVLMVDGVEQRCPFLWAPAVPKDELGISIDRFAVNMQNIFRGHLVHTGERAGVIEVNRPGFLGDSNL